MIILPQAISPSLIPPKRPPLSRFPSKKSDGQSVSRKSVSPHKGGLTSLIRKPSIIDRLNDSGASYRNYLQKIDSKQLQYQIPTPSSTYHKRQETVTKFSELSANLQPIQSMGHMERGSSRSSSQFYASKTILEQASESLRSGPFTKMGQSDKNAFIKNKTNSRLKQTGVSDSPERPFGRSFLRKKVSSYEQIPEPPPLRATESRAEEEMKLECSKVSMMVNQQKSYNRKLQKALQAVKGFIGTDKQGDKLQVGRENGVDWSFLKLILQKRIVCQDTRLS